jgi:gentisate 1,2-dioxygenase
MELHGVLSPSVPSLPVIMASLQAREKPVRPKDFARTEGFIHPVRRTMLGLRRIPMAITETEQKPKALPEGAREAMERLNAEAGKYSIWLRTQANAPSQLPWFRETGLDVGGTLAPGRVGANQMKALPHRWRWKEISPYLDRISQIAKEADVPPIEFADRQQFLLTNPGLGGRLQVTSTIRCAVSIYNPGDVAPVHVHAPNASRTILSEKGGYTTIEG